jgi:hypothetical protein
MACGLEELHGVRPDVTPMPGDEDLHVIRLSANQ